jgi:hypothetical protein
MRVSKNKCLLTLCAALLFLLIEKSFAMDDSTAASLLPAGFVIETAYKPGFGEPVGKVLVVQGDVVIIHANEQWGYMAAKDLPLYKNDTVVTQLQGRIRLMLNDGSLLTLASMTKLVINRSVFEPKKKSRSSFIQLGIGKVRFWVRKLLGYNPSEFKVKTPTAVAGVRGSDFVIRVTPTRTEVTALERTELEVVSAAAPSAYPTLVVDFERTVIEAGATPSEVDKVSPEEIEQIKREVPIASAGIESEDNITSSADATETSAAGEDGEENEQEAVDAEQNAGAESEGQQEESLSATQDESIDASAEGADSEAGISESNGEEISQGGVVIANVVESPIVLVPETDLVMPEELTDIHQLEAEIPPELTEVGIIPGQEQEVLDQQQEIMEQVQENTVELRRSLPDFPGTPQ